MRRDMFTTLPYTKHLTFDTEDSALGMQRLVYEMQPIVRLSDCGIFGHELLYRGMRPVNWSVVDHHMLCYLGGSALGLAPLFVNLSNETLMAAQPEILLAAARTNRVFFELSEAHSNHVSASSIAEKVNALSGQGVRFAIDDFGAGVDGFARLLALDEIAVIKLDGALVRLAQERRTSEVMLSAVIGQWHSLGILTVAECVETPELLETAHRLGVDLVQGRYVDKLVSHAPSLLVPSHVSVLSSPASL